MDPTIRIHLDQLHSKEIEDQNKAYFMLLKATESPVDWAYEAWDEMLLNLQDKDNRLRSISAQVFSNLAKSDPEGRMLRDFDKLLAVTRDPRFVTARHCLQSLWKVGLAGKAQQQMVVAGLETRFNDCLPEKNCTLIRYDIQQDLRNLYNATGDETIKAKALALIETEADIKYRKKYAGLWKMIPKI